MVSRTVKPWTGKLEVVVVGAFSRLGRNVRADVVCTSRWFCVTTNGGEQREFELCARHEQSYKGLLGLLPTVFL